MPNLSIDGRRINYEIHGSGEPMVLMHHGFGCLKMFKEIYPSLVEAGWQVILYDRRGYGSSEPGDDYQSFFESDEFRPAMAAEMAEVFNQLNIGPAHIVGQCEGGVSSVDFAVAHPELVRSLVLGSVQTWSMVEMTQFNSEKFPKSFSRMPPEFQTKFVDWHGEDWAEPFFEMARTRGGAYGVSFYDLRPALVQVKCPALVIYPDRSALFDIEQATAMYKSLNQGELAVMPYCGHNTYEYRPDEYSRLIIEFQGRMGADVRFKGSGQAAKRPDLTRTCAS